MTIGTGFEPLSGSCIVRGPCGSDPYTTKPPRPSIGPSA